MEQDSDKTSAQLIAELSHLKKQVSRLKAAAHEQTGEVMYNISEDIHMLSDQSLLAIMIIQDTKIKYSNEAAVKIYGHSKEEFFTKDLASLMIKHIHPADLPFVMEQLKKKQSGDTCGIVDQYIYRFVTETGDITWLEQYSKTINYKGRPADLVTAINITEHKKAEQELNHLRNYLANIINSMPSVLVGVDPMGKVTQWNAEAQRVTGVSEEKAMGQPLIKAFPRLISEMEKIHETMQTRKISFKPRQLRVEEDETHYEDITVYPLTSNGVEGAVIRIDDVTNKVRIEEMMVQSEKMMSVGGLAAGMAHEINNPLAGMILTADVLHRRLSTDLPANKRAALEAGTTMEAVRTFMESRDVPQMLVRIQESGERTARIVSNMLSFARKSDLNFSMNNIAELLDNSIDLSGSDYDLKKNFDFRKIDIKKEYDQNLPDIYCEAGKIQQVFLNILRNGAEAMHEQMIKDELKGITNEKMRFTLRLSHKKKTDTLHIEIEDNGPGMSDATRKRVFEPFFTTKPTVRGTGLGLSVSYFIITENHGGEMDVESSPETGTKFIISLPVKRKPS